MLRTALWLTVLGLAAQLTGGELEHLVLKRNFGTNQAQPDRAQGTWHVGETVVSAVDLALDDPARSMSFDAKELGISFDGLKKDARYELRLTYLSDKPGREQAVYVDGNLVREQFILPSRQVLVQRIILTKAAAADGKAEVVIQRRAGPNAILSTAELYSDVPGLAKKVSARFFAEGHKISGKLLDENNARKALDGIEVQAIYDDQVLKAKTDARGEFSIEVPRTWSRDAKSEVTIKTSAGTKPVRFEAGLLRNESFRREVLDTTCKDPFELEVAPDGRIFYIERLGALKRVIPETKESKLVAQIPVYSKLDDGMLGLALDPGFEKNGWIYLCYSDPDAPQNLVVRYTLTKSDRLLEDSKKVVLVIPTHRDTPPCHTGGSLAFDSEGNLFISTGDYTNPFQSQGYAPTDERKGRAVWDAQSSSADTSSLLGKILRITPQADGSYTVPSGNLFARGSKKARPEIYVMGCRNPFRIGVDPKTNTLYWGEVGPDAGRFSKGRGPAGHDEINQAKQAGNYGWPHFVGNNKPYTLYNFITPSTELRNPKSPKNNSKNNRGLVDLPPAQPALIWYPSAASKEFPVVGSGGRCAMSGPVYHFDQAHAPSAVGKKYDNTLFIYDWMRSWIMACKLDSHENIQSIERFMPETTFKRPMDLEVAPDGTMYLLEWGSSYGGSNPDARLSMLVPGVEIGVSSAVGEEGEEEKLLAKFNDVLEGGDPAKGKELFKSPKGGCVYCHKSDEPGGVIGPDLDGIANKLSRRELLEAVVFPSKRIDPPYLNATIELKDGESIVGSVVAQGHKVTIKDSDGAVVDINQEDIKSMTKAPSPMPAGAGESLSPEEMRNLIAYLSRLKGGDGK